ncbi:probable UDP-D-xylose:L-fucose alpha-1,3-D-xylosyltransferase MGP4 [Coccomyxa sp. Obi]|nr:probable UDP-D-xylose:L-fucose alpha-1,3-D-xylosyltransferase MGP4 [Coccomyxa sp. Obi]
MQCGVYGMERMARWGPVGAVVLLLLLFRCNARSHNGRDPLRSILERVAVDKTVILTQASCPYLDFAENWILHVEGLKIKNYLILVDDDVAFKYLDKNFPGHTVHPSIISNAPRHGPKPLMRYDSLDFNNMMCQRLGIQKRVLDLGFSFLWTDMDTVWFQDASKIIPRGFDFVGTGDRFRFGHDDEEENKICGCMTFWSPTVPARQALREWHAKCINSNVDDQRTLQEMWASGDLKQRLFWYIMPWQLFPSGALLDQVKVDFSHSQAQDNPGAVLPAVIHANYRTGPEAKRKFLQERHAVVGKGNVAAARQNNSCSTFSQSVSRSHLFQLIRCLTLIVRVSTPGPAPW